MAKLNTKDVDLSTLDRTYKDKKWAKQKSDIRGGKARYNRDKGDGYNQMSEQRNRLVRNGSDWVNVVSDEYRNNYDKVFKQ